MWTHLRTFCQDETGDASLQAMLLLAVLTAGLTLLWGRLAAGPSPQDLGVVGSAGSATGPEQLNSVREALWRQAAAAGCIR